MLIPFKELFTEYDIKTKGILHFGGNLGQEYQYYKDLGVENIAFVEALPSVYEQLCKNAPDAINILACLSDIDDKEVKFNIANNDGQSSSFLEFGTHEIHHPTVKFIDSIQLKTARFDTLCGNIKFPINNFDFLVADIQGAELLALKGMGDLLNNFKYIYLEVNTDYVYQGNALIGEVEEYLSTFGFIGGREKVHKVWCWGDKIFIKK